MLSMSVVQYGVSCTEMAVKSKHVAVKE